MSDLFHTKDTILLSLDTSTTISGFAKYTNAKLTEHGVFNREKEKDTENRIENMILDLINYIKNNHPNIIVIERPPACADSRTTINLAEIVGSIRGIAATYSIEYVEKSPNTWRKDIVGDSEKIPIRRKDCKPWDIKKCKEIFDFTPIDDNEADAVLIGLARILEMQRCEEK